MKRLIRETMKRGLLVVCCLAILSGNYLKADEGMWMLPLLEELNMPDMKELGVKLTADQIYDINTSSLKDAIVIFGGGCTGEIVSNEGLIFTNHHCGYSQIQQHSTVENDYLRDGFWAMTREEELSNPDLEVSFLERIEDVTDQILLEITDTMTNEEKRAQINETIKEIESDASQDKAYKAVVKSFYDDNSYYLCVYTIYKDVRFVGAPPSSIGKFGYDSDNWEWPRHTGDFSIFRVYTAPNGSPAEYSPDNIPFKPKCYLPVSLSGVEEGDFTFIMGYPGRTHRYLSSFGIQETIEAVNNNRIKIRGNRLDILKRDMEKDPELRIQYATKYSRSSNYWKYSIGQNRGVNTLKVLDQKRQEEAEFQTWSESDSSRNEKYGMVLSEIESIYSNQLIAKQNFYAINESFLTAAELIGFIYNFKLLVNLYMDGEDDSELFKKVIGILKEDAEKFFKDYNVTTDIKVTKSMFKLYKDIIRPERHPDVYSRIEKKYKGDIDKFVEELYSKTIFSDKEKTLAFLDNPSLKILSKDFGLLVTSSIYKKYLEEGNILKVYNNMLSENERLYMQGRMEMNPEIKYYPDANFTMRLTYGSVEDYSPSDAKHYDEFTYLKGVMEKEDASNFEFFVPSRLKELYEIKDYGEYGIGDKMPVCFITTNDITGGNSGSPVLNANGELIGLAFDGNWEAMSGDIAFEPEIQRCICVDIRYVLFIIDKYAGASHLIDELKILN